MSREIMNTPKVFTDATGLVMIAPVGEVGILMSEFNASARAKDWNIKLALVGGGAPIVVIWGQDEADVWGVLSSLNAGAALATDKTYHIPAQYLGRFKRIYPQTTSAAPTSMVFTLSDVRNTSDGD